MSPDPLPHVLSWTHDRALGLLSVEHDGGVSWDELQALKNCVWGEDSVALEVYPPAGMVINSGAWRHLWRLGPGEFWPDLAACGDMARATLAERLGAARMEAAGGAA
jgi:hypothetical protein